MLKLLKQQNINQNPREVAQKILANVATNTFISKVCNDALNILEYRYYTFGYGHYVSFSVTWQDLASSTFT